MFTLKNKRQNRKHSLPVSSGVFVLSKARNFRVVMPRIRNPRSFLSILKCVSQVSVETQTKPFKPQIPEFHRCFATVGSGEKLSVRTRMEFRKQAEVAMLDYFYINRGLQFLVAESMSKNAPLFNDNLLKKLNCDVATADADDDDVALSITRFLRYHPINEFEPFFESLGLKPSEYSHLLPSDKMFLNEDAFLLENYNTFWIYGIGLKQMGKIFKEARQVFGYEPGVLASKIKALEDLGLTKSFVSRIIVCSPSVLIGNMNVEVAKALEILKFLGIGVDWVNENLSEEEESYDWRSMHRVLSLLRDLCFDDNELGEVIKKHPRLFFEDSGEWTVFLVGFQTKLGSSRSELTTFFQKFPEIEVKRCVLNLRHCFLFLNQIKMECDEIAKIFRSHSSWLVACRLKKKKTLLDRLNVGTRRLCQVIQENPEEMKKWTMGLKVQPLPSTGEEETSRLMKTQFLLNLGFEENSEEMDRAVKKFRGKGSELQQRFDFLVSLGLNEKDVRNMVNAFPQILCQTSDLLEAKVNYIVNELGYPFSIFVTFPSCLVFTLQRMKLRLGMIPFLEGKATAISSLLACSDQHFVTHYVNRHPDGPKHWEDLKEQILYE